MSKYSYSNLIVKKYSELEKIEKELKNKLYEQGLKKQEKIAQIIYLEERIKDDRKF